MKRIEGVRRDSTLPSDVPNPRPAMSLSWVIPALVTTAILAWLILK